MTATYEVLKWEYLCGKGVYSCCVVLHPEDGGYWTEVPSLPGVLSQGDSIEGAVENTKEALVGVVESYLKDGDSIPWVQGVIVSGGIQRWIEVQLNGNGSENVSECLKCSERTEAQEPFIFELCNVANRNGTGEKAIERAWNGSAHPQSWESEVFMVSKVQGPKTCQMLAKNAMLRRKAMRDYERKSPGLESASRATQVSQVKPVDPHWEVVPAHDGNSHIGYRVRWSEEDTEGRHLSVRHYLTGGKPGDPSLGWCQNAAESDAQRFNVTKRCPWEFPEYPLEGV